MKHVQWSACMDVMYSDDDVCMYIHRDRKRSYDAECHAFRMCTSRVWIYGQKH